MQELYKFLGKTIETDHKIRYNSGIILFAKGGFFMPISEPTAVFSIRDERDMEIKQAVLQVYRALEEKGYNPINQLVGYILSEDPTYITTYKNARAIIRRIDRDDLLQALVRDYVKG